MTRIRRLALALLTGGGILAVPAGAIAAGSGGGGGGGSMPSSSAPSYDPAAEYRKGVEALQANQFNDAARAFGRVVDAAPRNAYAFYMLGLSKAGQQDLKAARKAYEKAVKLDATLVPARRELGVTLAKLGDAAKAQAQLDELKARDATCAGTCAQSADLKAAVGAIEAAIATPSAGLDTAPSLLFASAATGDGAYLEAVGLINEGRYDAAIASLRRAEAAFGPHPDVLTYLGFANRKLGRFDVAEDYYQAALAAAPAHRGATEYYGELKVERGDLAGAEAMLARLDTMCRFGCAEAEELRRWIDAARATPS
jgi:tetratricopeptide (TPR) repeat protein